MVISMDQMTLIIISVCAGFVLAWCVHMFLSRSRKGELDQTLRDSARNALTEVSEQLLMLAETRFKNEHTKIDGQFETRTQQMQAMVDKMHGELVRYAALMKEFEQDRTQKFGSLKQQLEASSRETEKLHKTTDHLTNILGNVKLRGQWGERMAEDILNLCGLKEGIQYEKQQQLDTNELRPDYTFYLPGDHKLVMDVKFPLNRYTDYVNAESPEAQEQQKKLFLNDVKLRIKEIASKEYVPAGEQTLDYVLLFVPNEQVYGFINEHIPGIIDDTLKNKIIL